MAHIVILLPVASAKIAGILRENGTAESKWRKAPVRHLVERVSVGIVGLKDPASPPRKPLFERNDHAVVVGYGLRLILRDAGKSRIRAWSNRRAAAHRLGEGSESKYIGVRIIKKLVDPVIAKVTDRQGSRSTETLLGLQTPFLILRRMHRICRSLKARGSEVWICGLDLRKGLPGGKAFRKGCIGVVGILGQAVGFTGSEVVTAWSETIEERRVVS